MSRKFELKSSFKQILADTYTPVGIYLRMRDEFPGAVLLESSDYHGKDHNYSYIAADPIARFEVQDETIFRRFPDGSTSTEKIERKEQVVDGLADFSTSFSSTDFDLPFITDGIFGYTSYNAVRYFEDVDIQDFGNDDRSIPDMIYKVYRYLIVINHFNDEVFVFEHDYDEKGRGIDAILRLFQRRDLIPYKFQAESNEESNYTDQEFMDIVQKGKDHCQRGDVFQIVLSRRFEQGFEGDEFNVYRALRSINPSPYLFYFDYGGFKIFGSSPEAQIVIKDKQATIYPIAGTFRRTGNDSQDYDLAKKLFDDPKENSEHVMLVDLARNDLSRHGKDVEVKVFKEIQYYSHVIHLVSKVVGSMNKDTTPLQLVADTFPAGTLSGAPKHMAMTLIDRYENASRGYYGGAIGHISFNGDFNHAIMIRTFLSKGNKLFCQAGAGVVAKSEVESELKEVNNKLAALKKAIANANEL